MLVGIIYTARESVSEDTAKRSLKLYTNWTAPEGFEFTSHFLFADGTGGMGIAEVGSAEALLEATAPWAPLFVFKTTPVVEVSAAVPIFERVNTWRDVVR